MDIPPELVAAHGAVQWALLALPGVTGVGIGNREEDGELLDEPALRVMIQDLSQVPEELQQIVADVNFPVSLIEGEIVPCSLPDTSRQREIAGGIKIGTRVGSGTLGAVVKDGDGVTPLGLTCFHVVSDPSASDPNSNAIEVWQPDAPPFVVGVPPSAADQLGNVVRLEFPRTPPLPFAPERVSNVDAAVFSLETGIAAGRTTSPRIVGHNGGSTNLVPRVASLMVRRDDLIGKIVVKRGFTTGVTMGFLIGTDLTVPWPPGGPNAYLVSQYEIRTSSDSPGGRFCDVGDSGSLVLVKDTQIAVGLLYGMNGGGTTGIANAIDNVEAQLGITVVWP